MPLNKAWHLKNKMPKNASLEQRIEWHTEHLKHCKCRSGFPEKLTRLAKEKGILIPKQ